MEQYAVPVHRALLPATAWYRALAFAGKDDNGKPMKNWWPFLFY
jgi:hypothetical protein